MYGTIAPPDPGLRVRQIAVPPDARALSTLERVDYADAFLVHVGPPDRHSAEEWARAVLEEAPLTARLRLITGWSSLGLALKPRSPAGTVLGWEVRRNQPDHVLVGAGSRIGMPAELLFARRPDALLFATLVRHGGPLARGIWAGIEPVHVRVVRELLDAASRRAKP